MVETVESDSTNSTVPRRGAARPWRIPASGTPPPPAAPHPCNPADYRRRCGAMAAEPQRPIISKELLRELGDWRTEKEGRSLAAAGNVLQWEYQPPFLSGTVRSSGGATINARIKLGERATEVENLGVCRQARDNGRIRTHVLALVLATT